MNINIQRHFSDTAYLPTKSSRLNPNPNLNINVNTITKPSRGLPIGTIQQRGTMSMPTSPVMSKMVQGGIKQGQGGGGGVWDTPQTAQAFFSFQDQHNNIPQPHQQLQNQQQQPYITHVSPFEITPPSQSSGMYYDSTSNPTTTSLQYISPQSTNFFFHDRPEQGMDIDSPLTNENDNQGMNNFNYAQNGNINNQPNYGLDDNDINMDMDMDTGPGGRKKRIQVRIACTHCQKACKKCSNTRPCERCVKYGLTDCVDSTRKPRKTGIKRGPYKRRSAKYPNTTQNSYSNNYSPNMKEFNDVQVQGYTTKINSSNTQSDILPQPHQPHFNTNTNVNAYSQVNTNPHSSIPKLHDHLTRTNHTKANFSHLQVHVPPHPNHTQANVNNSINVGQKGNRDDQILPLPKASTELPQRLNNPNLPLPSNVNHHQPSQTQSQGITYPPFPKPFTNLNENPSSDFNPSSNFNPCSNSNPGNNSNPAQSQITNTDATSSSNNLIKALSNALSVPQTHWVNGQRIPINPSPTSTPNSNLSPNSTQVEGGVGKGKGKTSPLYPKTPIGPFPISLFGKEDPFSRAVSPIKQFGFDFGRSTVLNEDKGVGGRNGLDGVREESEGIGSVSPMIDQNTGQDMSNMIGIGEISPKSIIPTPTENTQIHIQSSMVSVQPQSQPIQNPKSNLTINTTQTSYTSNQILSPQPNTGISTPFMFPVKIRKPSLRTLMSTNSSRAPSPSILPTSITQHTSGIINRNEIQSPTLFNDDDGKSMSGMLDEINSNSLGLGLGSWDAVSGQNQPRMSNEVKENGIENQSQSQNHNHIQGDGISLESLMGIH